MTVEINIETERLLFGFSCQPFIDIKGLGTDVAIGLVFLRINLLFYEKD